MKAQLPLQGCRDLIMRPFSGGAKIKDFSEGDIFQLFMFGNHRRERYSEDSVFVEQRPKNWND